MAGKDMHFLPRCGDTVFHRPTGETWVVAYAEGEHLAWFGWPDGLAKLSDCEVTERCSDEEHAKAVDEWRRAQPHDDRGNPSHRRSKVLALYGTEEERRG